MEKKRKKIKGEKKEETGEERELSLLCDYHILANFPGNVSEEPFFISVLAR